MKKTSTTFLMLLFSYSLLWAAWQLPITNYYPKEYEAGTQNWQFKQQQNGWMYSANNYGLLEFDGSWWHLYGISNSTVIRSVEIDLKGDIYVGGTNEFGRFVSNNKGELTYTPLSENIAEEYKNFGEVWNLHILHNHLYVQTRNYFFKTDTTGNITPIVAKSKMFCSANIRNHIYVAMTSGLYVLVDNQFELICKWDGLQGFEIRSLHKYGNEGILIGTDLGALFLYNGTELKPFRTEADQFLRKNQLYSLAVSDKYIACGTVLNGLVLMDYNGQNCKYISTKNGLQNNTILSLLFDDNRNLWMGLDQGIGRLSIDSPVSSLYGQLALYGSGYTTHLSQSGIYLGSNQGLYYSPFPFPANQQPISLAMLEGSLGQVWNLDYWNETLFCSHNRGLFEVNGNKLTSLFTQEGFWQVRATPTHPNYLIAGSYSGLYVLQKVAGKYQVTHKIRGYEETARNFEFDANGNIWIVTTRGVEKLTCDAAYRNCSAELICAMQHQSDYFSVIKVDDKIIITNNTFCAVLQPDGQLMQNSPFFDKLDGVTYYADIQKDEENNLWYIVANALKVRLYDFEKRQHQMHTLQIINQPHYFIGGFAHMRLLGNRETIIGSLSGFELINLDYALMRIQQPERSLYIREMTITTPKDSLIYGESYPLRQAAIAIPYKSNSLRFQYGGTLGLDGLEEYAVRLLPLDSAFSIWQKSNVKEYTTLREGKYTFEVKARNSMGSEVCTASVSFVILPPWYRTWWAYVCWVLSVLLFGYALYRYLRRNIEYGKRKLARQKDEEMRIREQQFAEETHKRELEILRLENERAEFELKNKSNELANVLLNHVNKNELVTDIKRDLRKIADELKAKETDAAYRRINTLQAKLTRNIEQEIDWNKFEENFDIVHNQFLKRLNAKFPWLSKSERKLCVYIHMGLYTKEIAPLMNLSVRGVEMLRYRMRKKMDLERSDDLETFFQVLSQKEETFATSKPTQEHVIE